LQNNIKINLNYSIFFTYKMHVKGTVVHDFLKRFTIRILGVVLAVDEGIAPLLNPDNKASQKIVENSVF
jgi:hypothetical protein